MGLVTISQMLFPAGCIISKTILHWCRLSSHLESYLANTGASTFQKPKYTSVARDRFCDTVKSIGLIRPIETGETLKAWFSSHLSWFYTIIMPSTSSGVCPDWHHYQREQSGFKVTRMVQDTFQNYIPGTQASTAVLLSCNPSAVGWGISPMINFRRQV